MGKTEREIAMDRMYDIFIEQTMLDLAHQKKSNTKAQSRVYYKRSDELRDEWDNLSELHSITISERADINNRASAAIKAEQGQ